MTLSCSYKFFTPQTPFFPNIFTSLNFNFLLSFLLIFKVFSLFHVSHFHISFSKMTTADVPSSSLHRRQYFPIFCFTLLLSGSTGYTSQWFQAALLWCWILWGLARVSMDRCLRDARQQSCARLLLQDSVACLRCAGSPQQHLLHWLLPLSGQHAGTPSPAAR